MVVKYFYSQKTGCYLHFTGAKKSAIKKTLSTSGLYCKIVPIKILILTEDDNIHKDKLNKSDGQTNNAKKRCSGERIVNNKLKNKLIGFFIIVHNCHRNHYFKIYSQRMCPTVLIKASYYFFCTA